MSEPLHVKYRPQDLDGVIGQDAVCKNLRTMHTQNRLPHTYLFTGPAGTGKTTLARIVAGLVGCDAMGITEVDAARYSGVDQMRDLLAGAQFVGLGKSNRRMIVLDECHKLSKAAWDALLKESEEPPDHLYFAFCTTEPDKVPKTIVTRSHAYDMKPVKWDLLSEYMLDVCAEEKLRVKEDFIALAARKAEGSVRQGLVYLSVLDGITSKEDALRLLDSVDAQDSPPVELARMLVSAKGATWANARKLLEGMKDVSPETIRLTVVNYTANAMLATEGPGQAAHCAAILEAFSKPCNPSEKMAPVLLAVGTLLLGG